MPGGGKLDRYDSMRDFKSTPEPAGRIGGSPDGRRRFVVQRAPATRLHWDMRLEVDGVLVSWAVPRGPGLDPARKSLAVRTEDHPYDYGWFEGVIRAATARATWCCGTTAGGSPTRSTQTATIRPRRSPPAS